MYFDLKNLQVQHFVKMKILPKKLLFNSAGQYALLQLLPAPQSGFLHIITLFHSVILRGISTQNVIKLR